MKVKPILGLIAAALLLTPFLTLRADEPIVPKGFRAIFNGKNLEGWYGLNPHDGDKLRGEQKAANHKRQRADFPKHWRVENGELVNGGDGPYATSDEEFGDIELLIEYKTVPKADSGVYLRGSPQVQIWDWNQIFDPKNPTRKPHLGSGGLFNNTPGSPGRDPLVLADRPFGEWNQFRIRQIGDVTWVWLNGKLVVDHAKMENYWDRAKPIPSKGPIMLQTHGGEIRWRNIFVRDIDTNEAKQLLSSIPKKEQFYLFLLIGQSNMAGRGAVEAQDKTPHPRVLMLNKQDKWVPAADPIHFDKPVAGVGLGKTFGVEIAETDPNITVGLIPCAVGGSPIDSWKPGQFYPPTNSHPWDDAIKRAKLALESGSLKGILWHQGESDSTSQLAPVYEAKLHDLIKRLRSELNAPDVPFIAGQMGHFADVPWNAAQEQVNQAHQTLSAKVPNTAFISAEGLKHNGDKVHFDAASLREFGKRYAAAFKKLVKVSS